MNDSAGESIRGFALIDAVVALSVAAILISGLIGVASAGAGLVAEDKAKTGATELLSQKFEALALLSYADFGTVGGTPGGVVLPSESVTVNNFPYTVTTGIGFVDDPDGAGAEDYKAVRVTVSWESPKGPASVSAVTYRAP